MIARVRDVAASASRSGSRFPVSSRTSTKTGFAPTWATASAVAMKVNGAHGVYRGPQDEQGDPVDERVGHDHPGDYRDARPDQAAAQFVEVFEESH